MKKIISVMLSIMMLTLSGVSVFAYAPAVEEPNEAEIALTEAMEAFGDLSLGEIGEVVDAMSDTTALVEDAYEPVSGEMQVSFDPFIDTNYTFTDKVSGTAGIAAGGNDMFLFSLAEERTVVIQSVSPNANFYMFLGTVDWTTGTVDLIGNFGQNTTSFADVPAGDYALVALTLDNTAATYYIAANTTAPYGTRPVSVGTDLEWIAWYSNKDVFVDGKSMLGDLNDIKWERTQTNKITNGSIMYTQRLWPMEIGDFIWIGLGGYEDKYNSIPVGQALHFQYVGALWSSVISTYINNTGNVYREVIYTDLAGRQTPLTTTQIEGTLTLDLNTGKVIQYNSSMNLWLYEGWANEQLSWSISADLYGYRLL